MQTVGFEECCDTSASKHEEYTLMIIKITRSTSRISINGTTFMSETIPRLPPTDIPIIHLVFGDSDRVGANVRSKMPREEDSHIQRERVEQAPPLQTEENYWPASSLAVIKPILSMPAPRMISMARGTSMHSTSLSPLTKAIFSARSLKICSMRGPSPSQVVSSLFILSLPFMAIWTTTDLFSSSTFCCL